MRQVRNFEGLEGPVFTDSYVAVCCKRMLKIVLEVRSTIMSTTGLYITDFSTYPNYPEGLTHL
jgi:hypothetical protein